MGSYAIGLDYGTNSCRSLLVNLENGDELGSAVYQYPSGERGILSDASNPNIARQHPQDYLDGLEAIIRAALEQATATDSSFDPAKVVGIGVDTTGSTPIPVDGEGIPLGLKPEFADNLNAMAWLWKDHTSHAEAARITATAARMRPALLAKCGGIYSSEWWWSKIWHCRNMDPGVFAAARSWVEHCDWIPAVLTGTTRPEQISRSVCAAGHKAMFSEEWGGLPDKEFLGELDPALAELRDRLYRTAMSADKKAGGLTAEWADKLGLQQGTAVAVGAFDAHMGAVGAGVTDGTLVKVLGTSTCDITVVPNSRTLANIPGLCGVANESVLPGHYGIEAGQSAVGDIFLWFAHNLVPESYGKTVEEKFTNMEQQLAKLAPGETGLLALDWNNGNRTVLVDVRLTGLLLGQTLHTQAHEIYRALIEATAFGALTIIKRMEEYGIEVREVVNTGGLSLKNETLMQIYADVIGLPMKVAASQQTCALGAALFGAAASGTTTLSEAQRTNCKIQDRIYSPNPENHQTYARIYQLYRQLHDAFGTAQWQGNMAAVMKDLIAIRQQARNRSHRLGCMGSNQGTIEEARA